MHPKYQVAVKLRLKGKSYNEIARTLSVSKSSLSLWLRNLTLPKSAQKRLKRNIKMARNNGLFRFNRKRTHAIKIENRKIKQAALKEIHSVSEYELLLLGASLYWGEGTKKYAKKRSPYVCFANSDPNMVVIFLRFLREILHVPEEKLKTSIHIHPNIDPKKIINFWSRITNIPKNRFRIVNQTSKASKGKRSRNSLPYGTLDLRVHSRQTFFQIKGWIDGLIKQT